MDQYYYLQQHMAIFILVVLWSTPWKGVALWKAAQKKDLYWFIALMIFNTIGILEILYIYYFSQPKKDK